MTSDLQPFLGGASPCGDVHTVTRPNPFSSNDERAGTETRICEWCSGKYEWSPKRWWRKHCCRACTESATRSRRNAVKHGGVKRCAYCSKALPRYQMKYCDPVCFGAANRDRRSEAKRKKSKYTFHKNCVECGNEIKATPTKSGRRGVARKFCSDKCRWKRNDASKKGMVSKWRYRQRNRERYREYSRNFYYRQLAAKRARRAKLAALFASGVKNEAKRPDQN